MLFLKSSRTSVENMIEDRMNNKVKNSNVEERPTVYGAIGLAIFLICCGISYLVPNIFPVGTLFIIAGILFILINIVKSLKNIGYDFFEILIGMILLVSGLNRMLNLEIGFTPVVIIVLAVIYLFRSIKKLRNGQTFI